MTPHRSRRRNAWLQIATLFGLFTGGGLLGWALAAWAAPGSGLAAGVSGLLLPAAFCTGLIIWGGIDLLLAVVHTLRGRTRQPRADLSARTAAWFVPLALAFSIPGGLLVGLLPGSAGMLPSAGAYGITGFAFGVVAARLATAGYLPAPHLE